MKVLALNSSPRGQGQSKTELMLTHLVRGMTDAGAEVEIVKLRKKKVNNCIGCFTCWTKTPGTCIHKDDMTTELYPTWLASDLVVYGTPLYHFTVNASMKAFVERTLPILQPFFTSHGGRTAHPMRHKHPAVVMLSVAGFPERTVFDQLSSWANFIFSRGLVGEVYRPGAEMMLLPFFKKQVKDVLDATVQAGRELVTSMRISSETQERIEQPIGDVQFMMDVGNPMWKTCIAEGLTPKELHEKGVIVRPNTIQSFTTIMRLSFNREAAGNERIVLQFVFTGEQAGNCTLVIDHGTIETPVDYSQTADLTVETPYEVWMDIITGKADGEMLFEEGKYRVQGDPAILSRFPDLFSNR